ncbi:PEBP-like protein [Lophiostoma macrostomum CBS 122681]|uniref:Large ribosomal subunit protein mL38 n=1 Tax=Lophiostoma macrostomum CBS 122681 TaxID=1314788 RepID=A0A6A6TMN1_9PLEO|nr:PEBP-like protein [Lophiostoma macrostomum CBS 122681]
MASVKPSLRQFSACIGCVRRPSNGLKSLDGGSARFLSTTAPAHEELQTETATPVPQPPLPSVPTEAKASTKPEWMQQWGELDPNRVEDKRAERRLIRREGIQPVGSRRRRAAIHRSTMRNVPQVPFEQLPYQCFQEARKFLLDDRQEKLKQIQTQTLRLRNLMAQDPAVSGGPEAKNARVHSMRNHINELVILADINDPVVKKNFEDGLADMNKPIYRHLAQKKWEKHKKLVLDQRLTQMNVVPDILPALDSKLDIDLAFGRKKVEPGEFVESAISEKMPRLRVQSFESGEKLVSVVVVDPDVPVPEKDGFKYRCHFLASNIPISPTKTSIPLIQIEQQDRKVKDPSEKKIALPWYTPWAHRGAPYHRLAVFVLEQADSKPLDVAHIAKTKRNDFILRSFVDKHKLTPLGATLFRTKWDESMAGVMQRAGLGHQVDVEFKRKRIEPLPYKRRTERMR